MLIGRLFGGGNQNFWVAAFFVLVHLFDVLYEKTMSSDWVQSLVIERVKA